MDGKYISKKEDGVANCPFCRGVIFRDLKIDEVTGRASFVMRCPHCQKDVEIIFDKEAIIQKSHNEPKN